MEGSGKAKAARKNDVERDAEDDVFAPKAELKNDVDVGVSSVFLSVFFCHRRGGAINPGVEG